MNTEAQVVETKRESKSLPMENGNYSLTSIGEQMTYAQWLIDKKLVSNTFTTSAQLVVAIQLCKDLGLPNSALSCFYVIGGKPAIYGDVLIGLVMGSGQITGKRVSYFDESGETIVRPKKGQEILGCEVFYKRKDMEGEVGAFYTLDDKEKSKTTNPTWLKYETDMLWRRADVRAIKMIAPDTMKGIEVVEYLEDAENSGKKGVKNLADELTKTFSGELNES
jgi:hypothetical protein